MGVEGKREGKLNEAEKSRAEIKSWLRAKSENREQWKRNTPSDDTQRFWLRCRSLKWPQRGMSGEEKKMTLTHWTPHRKLKLCPVINLGALLVLSRSPCEPHSDSLRPTGSSADASLSLSFLREAPIQQIKTLVSPRHFNMKDSLMISLE